MAQKLRPEHEGVFHVTARSVAEEHIFRTTADYLAGVDEIARLVRNGDIVCHAFCLMPTHYHLVGWFEHRALAPAVQRINRRYAGGFNRRHHRRGHVFDSPYAAVPVLTDEHYVTLIAYVARNPPDHERWPWSSYPGAIGLREQFSFVDPAPVLAAFGSPAELRRFVDAWTPKPRDASLLRGGRPIYSERRIATAPPPSATRSKPFRS